jgi:DNA-binding response OmpR family regulator
MIKITIIEDYAPLARLMADFLRAKGHHITVATNAAQGLQRLLESPPDVALIDLALGDETGLEVMRQAKAQGCRSKFIFVTGCNEVSTAIHMINAGAEDYLTKPFDLANLVEALNGCLNRVAAVESLSPCISGINPTAPIEDISSSNSVPLQGKVPGNRSTRLRLIKQPVTSLAPAI